MTETTQVRTFCALCVSRCGATATVAGDRLVALGPDPAHPTGQALCVKGKAAPELVHHPERLLHPLVRTNPKGAADPGWRRVTWDEALDITARRLRALADEHGPESVGFSCPSPSTSAMSDAVDWVMRLRRAFGSPNMCVYMELCGWGRYLASLYTYGAPVPGVYMPDLDNAGCILFWGYNPSVSRLSHATATVAALRRGARLVVVDPRRAGLAGRADHWLRVRPGTDTALALALTHVMIENGWYDEEFVRQWTNAPQLVRTDNGRLLRDDVAEVTCRPVFDLLAEQCARMAPDVAETITGVPAREIEATARTLWESRPVAFYTWSGLEQHSDTSQAVRAIGQLYALTGSFDAPGGNVRFAKVPTNPVDGADLICPEQRAKALGLADRPLGPARFEFVTGDDFYTAALDGTPYRMRGLVNFGANLVMAHGDSERGRDALAALDFSVHADLFMSPTAELADVVLPVTSAFETEGLKVGFEVDQEAESLVQLRRPLVPPRGSARSDVDIIFELATRLGLGEHFWHGDVDAGLRHQLAPSGITLEQLRATPEGVRVPLETRHRKYVETGFHTPSGKVELYSETLLEHGYPPLPIFTEPGLSPHSRPDLAARFPLILTCAKSLRFCESQHRALPSLRGPNPDPSVELHPATAHTRGIASGDWINVETPHGTVRARAALTTGIDPGVVAGQHGWWQACTELGLPGYPPYGDATANLNTALRQQPSDPMSGSAPLRAGICEVTRLTADQQQDSPSPGGARRTS